MTNEPIVGGCQCEATRFALSARPLFTHACHCLVCRRRSGTAFALSTTVLRDDLAVIRGTVTAKPISPRTTIYRCVTCETTLYSGSTRYPATYIVRGGTFDDPNVAEPSAHTWVKRMHPWIVLPAHVLRFEEDYEINTAWPHEALARLAAANARISPGPD